MNPHLVLQRGFLTLLFCCSSLIPSAGAGTDVVFSDTHFITSFRDDSDTYQAYHLNRFRSEIDMHHEGKRVQLKAILDFESFLSRSFIKSQTYQALKDPDPNLPFNPYWDAFESDDILGRFHLYRFHVEKDFDNSRLTLGLQGVPFGVGRLWNPTDVFNPIEALSIEPDERSGVFAAHYDWYVTSFSSLQLISDFQKEMELNRYGFRFKGHHRGMDTGLTYIQNADFQMVGIELETNVFETGIAWHNEVGFFKNEELDISYVNGITGLEYGFPFNLNVLGEYFYNGLGEDHKSDYATSVLVNGNWNLARHYLGAQISYELTPLSMLSFSTILNINDTSLFSGPSLTYSVNDETTLNIGANLFAGENDSEFGSTYDNLYYVIFETFF